MPEPNVKKTYRLDRFDRPLKVLSGRFVWLSVNKSLLILKEEEEQVDCTVDLVYCMAYQLSSPGLFPL